MIAFDAFVLAGGASSRMGADKASMLWNGVPIVERALTLLRSIMPALGPYPRIAGSRDDLAGYAPVVADLHPGRGPLSGIEAGLASAAHDYVLFIPVDTPLLPAALPRFLLQRAALTGALMTVPRFLGREQPLCAVYHRRLLPAISHALDRGNYKVMPVLERAALDLDGFSAVDVFDVEIALAASGHYADWPNPAHRAFLNCNTPADFALASSWVAVEGLQ